MRNTDEKKKLRNNTRTYKLKDPPFPMKSRKIKCTHFKGAFFHDIRIEKIKIKKLEASVLSEV